MGLDRRKSGGVPPPRDPVAQEQFRNDVLEPLLEKARKGTRKVFFVDAAHFVHGAFLGYLWCFCRYFVPTGPGRKRHSVMGAVNAVTHEMIYETTTGSVNQYVAAGLLVKIRRLNPKGRITVVWDNARYQHTQLIRTFSALTQIDIVYLPPYSPHLNLIERVWKFVKKEALCNRYFKEFAGFQESIDTTLNELNTTHKEAMETLLTHNFQTLPELSN